MRSDFYYLITFYCLRNREITFAYHKTKNARHLTGFPILDIKLLHQGDLAATSRSCGPKSMEVNCQKHTGIHRTYATVLTPLTQPLLMIMRFLEEITS